MTLGINNVASALNHDYLKRYPAEASRMLDLVSKEERIKLFLQYSVTEATAIWESLPLDVCAEILPHFKSHIATQVLTRTDPVMNAHVLARMPLDDRERMLSLLDGIKRRELTDLLQYPEDSAGSLMDTRFLLLLDSMTLRDALTQLRRKKPSLSHHLFVVDSDGHLKGMVEIQELAISEGSASLSSITKPVVAAVLPTAVREEVVALLETHKLSDLPVVDVSERLVGVIRYNALVNAVREESSADILTMVGVSKNERALSKATFVVRKRLPWLHINLLTAFLAAAVVGIFEKTIAQFTALAILLPVVAGQSGNTGAQALAVTMRGLALHEIGTSSWRRVALKEIGAGFFNGLAIATTTSLGVLFWSSSAGLAIVIGLAMVISMVAAAFSGVIIPVFLTAMGYDPAQSSSIILTTITDVTGFFTFLGIATLLISIL